MKLTIALCDDDVTHVMLIREYINRYIQGLAIKEDISIIEAYSGEELLNITAGKNIDILFIDIGMKGLNGIEAGRRFREYNRDTIIVFITGYKGYALEAFELESLQYIVKPINIEAFNKLIEKILCRLRERDAYAEQEKSLTIKTRFQLHQIRYQDIYYLEKKRKKVQADTKCGTYEFTDTLQEITQRLQGSTFVRCHHGFVVNINKILHVIDDEIILRDIKKTIPISRKYKGDVIDALSKRLFDEG